MPMMGVGQVWMAMLQRVVSMPVGVRLVPGIVRAVFMPVMVVMAVDVRMRRRRMAVRVFVMLGEVKPHADSHQAGRGKELHGHRLTQRNDRGDGTEEGRRGEIGAGPRRPEMTQGEHEQGETDAVPQEANDARTDDGGRWREGAAHP